MSQIDKVTPAGQRLVVSALRNRGQTMGLFLVLLIMGVVWSVLSPYFLTQSNLLNVLLQSSITTIVAVGQTYVILTSGIDLSVGSVVALCAVVLGLLLKAGVPVFVAIPAALVAGMIIGLVNGVIITKASVPPFIMTLGMMGIARGLALILTGGQSLYTFPEGFRFVFGSGFLWIIPMPAVIAAIVVGVGAYILHSTRFGRYIYAVGGNAEAARLSGLPVVRVTIGAYVVAGITYAIGAAVLTARINSAQPIAGQGYELDAIAAVVLGGTSLFGGEGSLFGTVLGALLMGVLRNGLNLLNVSSFVQQVIIGGVIILAVAVDKLRRRSGS